jgi:uncharacterized protein YbaR (Trm112 family)
MILKCPICKGETKIKRSISGKGEMVEDFICESCHIAWYIPEGKKIPKIRVSTTHSMASKLTDEEFEELLKKIKEYEESHK